MPKKRKTFPITRLLHKVNKMNRLSTCSSEVRQGWNSILSDVLYESGVYVGFNYLGPEDVPAGHLPGIAFTKPDGSPLTPVEFYERLDAAQEKKFLEGTVDTVPTNGDLRVFGDETRRFYYVDAVLLKEYGKLEDAEREKLAGGAE